MYYRQRIMLGIFEKSGTGLYRTEMEKLLYLFCKSTGENHYDFFPGKSGYHSFVSFRDFGKLVKEGYLQEDSEGKTELLKGEDFQRIKRNDQVEIIRLVNKYKNHTMGDMEIEFARDLRENYQENEEPCLTGKGYEGKSIDRYLQELIEEDIRLVIDVRRNPFSMKFDFNKGSLKDKFKKVDIDYIHIPELGISSELRKEIKSVEEHLRLLDRYEEEFLPQASEYLNRISLLQEKYGRIVLLCFEKDENFCHRTRILGLLTGK